MAKLSDFDLLRQARRLGYTLENEDEILQKEAQRLGFNLIGGGATAPAPVFTAPPTTIGNELLEVLKGLPRGAAGLLETAATGAAALLPEQAERELRGEITEFFQPVREGLAPAAGYEESIGARAGEALGSTLPFLAAGPLGLAGRAAATGLGVAAGAGEARLRAEQEGGMEDRGAATALGALVGTTEVLPIFRILNRLPEKEVLSALDYVKRAAMAGGEEFAQEASANVAQNLIEKGLYNPEQEVFEGAAEEGAYGFGVGAFIQGLTDLAMGRRVRGGVAPLGGEDERAGIGAEQVVEGADTRGVGLPVSRVGAERPDVEGLATAGMGLPREPVGRVDEGAEVLQPALEGARFQIGEEDDTARPWYYSELKKQTENAPIKSAPAGQWLGTLKSKGVKDEEIEFTGLKDWLDTQEGNVSKEDVLNFINQNGIEIEEVTFGGKKPYSVTGPGIATEEQFDSLDDAENWIREQVADTFSYMLTHLPEGMEYGTDEYREYVETVRNRLTDEFNTTFNETTSAAGPAQYAGHKHPYGTNYREILISIPKLPTVAKDVKKFDDQIETIRNQRNIVRNKLESTNPTRDRETYVQLQDELRNLTGTLADAQQKREYFLEKSTFTESHWGRRYGRNVIGHIRASDMNDGKDLLVHEMQSQLAQTGGETGFQGGETAPRVVEYEEQTKELNKQYETIKSQIDEIDNNEWYGEKLLGDITTTINTILDRASKNNVRARYFNYDPSSEPGAPSYLTFKNASGEYVAFERVTPRFLNGRKITEENAVVGTRVMRGPDWNYSDQDGGEGNVGEIITDPEHYMSGWVEVRWENGHRNSYRVGDENSFDLVSAEPTVEPEVQAEPLPPYLTQEEFNEVLSFPIIQIFEQDSISNFNNDVNAISKFRRVTEEEAVPLLRNLSSQRQKILEQMNNVKAQYEDIVDKTFSVPKFPFSASTDKWQNLLLKRILKYAASNGYDKILFTQGQEAKRYTMGQLRGQEYFYDIISPKNIKNIVNKYKGKVTFSKAQSPWTLEPKIKDAIEKELNASPTAAQKFEQEGTGYSSKKRRDTARAKLLSSLRDDPTDLDNPRSLYNFGIGNVGTPEGEATRAALQEFVNAVNAYNIESAPYFRRGVETELEPITYQTRTVIEITPEMRSKLYEQLPLFRMGKKPVRTPMSVAAAQKVINDLSKGWANKPNIKVVATHKDLPKPYRLNKYKNAKGMLLGNDVYIVASNAGSPSDIKATLFHESLGHYGLRDLFRTRFDEVLNDIYKTNTAMRKAADEWLIKYPDVYQGRDRIARAVEEILAAKSEKGVIKEPGIRAAFNRLAAMIRKFLRAMGFVSEYSNNDINNILLEAAERVRSQPGPIFNTYAEPRFQIGQYNKVLTNALEVNQRLPEWSQSVGEGVAGAMATLPENLRKAQYYMYSMPQVIELLEKYTPRIRAIDRFIGYRASYTTGLMKTASESHAKYTAVAREYPDKYEEFKNVVNDINLFQVPVREQSVIDLLSQNRASLSPQKQKYYDVAKRFYDLPERMQNSILSANNEAGLFADYRKMGDKKFDIFAQVYGGQLGMGVVRDLRERFERERLPMYAPLVRGQGAHWLYYETTDGRAYKESFPNQASREVAIRKAIDEGRANPATITRATRASEIRQKGPPPVGFLGEVVSKLESTLPDTMPAAERKLIIDGVYDTFLDFLPSDMLRQELSTRQTFDVDGVRQFGVLGFDQDVLAVYERTMPKMAYQLGNLKFALPIENAMKKVSEQAKMYEIAYRENNIPDRLRGRKLMPPKAVFDGVEDMRRRINFAYNPSYAWWVNGLATGNYVYSIAGNVSSALINTTVLPMMTFPSLVARYGVIKSAAAMARASKMFAQGGVDDQGNFTFGNAATGEVKTFFDYLTKRGVIGIAAEQELRQAQRAKVSGYESGLDKLNFILGYVFKNSERFNREVTMLASFMLAREKGKSFKTAAEEAIRLNNNINGTVLPEAASRMYQTNLGRVILTFRTFALTQIINLSRAFGQALKITDAKPEDRSIARKQLLGIFGMTYMVAGVKGLPLFSAAEVLAAALMGDDDEPYDLQQEVADSIGLMGLNGPLNAAFGVDIASRTGFNGMLWRDDPKRLADIGFLLYSAERVLGPSYGLIQAQLRGVEKIAAGDIQRGFESILPAPIRNPLKAARYATDGALTKDGLPIVDDISTWNSVMQIFGFAPAELAATQEQIGAKFAISDKLRSRRTALLTNLYAAMTAGDDQAMQEAFEAIDKFNATNPMIGINPKSIQASFRERNRRAMEAINGIYLPRNLLATTEEYMADID